MRQASFDRILASLHEATFDDSYWSATSLLIDEAFGIKGNALLVGQGSDDGIRVSSEGLYRRGERQEDIEREYLEKYHPFDERVARVRQLPDSRVVHVSELYSAAELKTSPTYNELLPRSTGQNSLHVRLVLSPESSRVRRWRAHPGAHVWECPVASGRAPVAPCAPVRTSASGAGWRAGSGHVADGPAGQHRGGCHPPGQGRQGRCGERLRARHSASGQWIAGPGRCAECLASWGTRPSSERLIARALPTWSGQVGWWFDVGASSGRPSLDGARQPHAGASNVPLAPQDVAPWC